MNQRMKWDAEAAFKSLNAQGKRRQASIDDERLKTTPYTPPPNVAAWLQAQADKPKAGRDYEAILRAAKKKPVGYYEDAPTGIKFGKPPVKPVVRCIPRKPAPPQSADGGQPLPSASTKPHGKDVDTADGPWPKCVNWFGGAVYVFAGPAQHHGKLYRGDGTVDNAAGDYAGRISTGGRPMPNADAVVWLEAHGHKDVAAQLRGKPRDDVATGGGRVWRSTRNAYMWTRIGTTWYSYSAVRGAWDLYGVDYLRDDDMCGVWQELFGPERDAIVAECRKAMGL